MTRQHGTLTKAKQDGCSCGPCHATRKIAGGRMSRADTAAATRVTPPPRDPAARSERGRPVQIIAGPADLHVGDAIERLLAGPCGACRMEHTP